MVVQKNGPWPKRPKLALSIQTSPSCRSQRYGARYRLGRLIRAALSGDSPVPRLWSFLLASRACCRQALPCQHCFSVQRPLYRQFAPVFVRGRPTPVVKVVHSSGPVSARAVSVPGPCLPTTFHRLSSLIPPHMPPCCPNHHTGQSLCRRPSAHRQKIRRDPHCALATQSSVVQQHTKRDHAAEDTPPQPRCQSPESAHY